FADEKDDWEKQKTETIRKMEDELTQMIGKYTEEITEGRRWIEAEREKLSAERMAFQEEQLGITEYLELRRDELEAYKTEFLTKEHDLLTRVVNEKALLEAQRRDFERQRSADVMRLREEAEHLERCLVQVENAQRALDNSRKEYEAKNKQLNELKEMLVEYEQAYWKERGTRRAIDQ
ncbi:hypothetical protein AAVH_37034, partial [Aphelenchoides avenae]